MPEITDKELISRLLEATRNGKLAWEKTATADQFAASYGGKWTLTVDKSYPDESSRPHFYASINNSEGEEVLHISDVRESAVPELFEEARRHALKVKEAVNDLLKEIGEDDKDEPEVKDEDIPF